MATLIRHDATMALAENVKRLREKMGLSQTELADAIGTSHPRISCIERKVGNPTLSTITKLAEFFGVSEAELLSHPKKSRRSA